MTAPLTAEERARLRADIEQGEAHPRQLLTLLYALDQAEAENASLRHRVDVAEAERELFLEDREKAESDAATLRETVETTRDRIEKFIGEHGYEGFWDDTSEALTATLAKLGAR